MEKLKSVLTVMLLASMNCYSQLPSSAQNNINDMIPKPLPTSPNVTALGKFGDYKVSHFTGLPEISIPIFEAKSGSLSVPITLSYHASGVRPTDVASWVGMGWAISGGGQVSRSTRGKADEENYLFNALKLSPQVCGPSGTGAYNYLDDLSRGIIDGDPDIFSYSYPGRNGKFMVPYGEAPYLIPAAPIIINRYAFEQFDITDERGILYKYGSPLLSKEFSSTNSAGNPLNATTAWLMTDMIAPNSNDKISFTYQPVGNANMNDISYTYTLIDQCFTSNGGTCPLNPIPQVTNIYTSAVQRGIETILFETGKVEFVMAPGMRSDAIQMRALDSINIYSLVNGAYILIKTVKFVYSYFTNAAGGNAALKLDAVQFKDTEGKIIQQHRFTYFTNSFSWNPALNYLNSRDLWGYYNGASNSDLVLPQSIEYQATTSSPQTTMPIGGAYDRKVNPVLIKEGVLSRIDFPTGGYTIFDFEPHKYLNAGVEVLVGGLRVTKITSYDGSGTPPVIKTYKYGSGESGYGSPKFSQNQFTYSSTQQYYSDCEVTMPISNYRIRSFHSTSAFSLDAFDSSPMSYPYVTEYSGDPGTATIGKIVYEYDNGIAIPDAVDLKVPNSGKYYKPTFAWKRGLLTKKTIFDNLNNPISETSFAYSLYKATDGKFIGEGAWRFVVGNNQYCAGNLCVNEIGESVSPITFFSQNYFQSSGVYLQSMVSETLSENGNLSKYLATRTSMTYDAAKLQPITITKNRSNSGEESVTVNRYPFELSANVNSSSTEAAKGIFMLNNKNILSLPIETYTYLQNSDASNQRVVSGQVTTYRQNASNTNYVVPDQIYIFESGVTLPKASYAPLTINPGNSGIIVDSRQRPRINMVSYDELGNIQTVAKTNDLQASYLYGYNKTLPIAEVTNALNSSYQTTQITPSTVSQSFTFGGPTTGAIQTAQTFTTDYSGTVYLKLSVPSNPAYTTVASYNGITAGSVTLAKGACGLTVITFTSVAAGTYTLNITLTTNDTTVPSLGACGQIEYPKNNTVTNNFGVIEFLYESFEENSAPGVTINPAIAHSGNGYFSGDYTASFNMPNTRAYVIEYWHLDVSNAWQYTTRPYTGTSMLLSEGSAIDDVRIFPTDAQMKTYTYNPLLGMTSTISENGQTLKYNYDSFGRLLRVLNEKGNIERQYLYNYKGN